MGLGQQRLGRGGRTGLGGDSAIAAAAEPPAVRPRSRRASLAVLMLAAILPVLLVSGLMVLLHAHQDRAVVIADGRTILVDALGSLDAALAGDIAALRILAESGAVLGVNSAQFATLADHARLISGRWQSIVAADVESGREIYADPAPARLGDVKPAVRRGLEAMQRDRVPVVSGYVARDAALGQPLVMLWMPVDTGPVIASGLGVALDLSDLAGLLDLKRAGELAVIDRDGIVLIDSAGGEGRVGSHLDAATWRAVRAAPDGIWSDSDDQGGERDTVFRRSALTGWVIMYRTPGPTRQGALDAVDRGAALGSLLALMLSVVLSVFAIRDLNQRRRLENAAQQSHKVTLVSQVTGAVAHDFNNLWTVISGNLDLVATGIADNERLVRSLRSAIRAADRGAQMTERLLAYSRNRAVDLDDVDVNGLITGQTAILRRACGARVNLTLDLQSGLRPLRVDPFQLCRALAHVTDNAMTAMAARGGALRIRTREIGPAEARHRDLIGPSIEIAVSDTGDGMCPNVAERAFDPFFTTKLDRAGAGLGLTDVAGFVQRSGGRVFIDSRLGRGTTLFLLLPYRQPPLSEVSSG